MTTNAQAALQAAATAMQGRQHANDPGSLTGLADKLKVWLDRQDAKEEVSHHISCHTRLKIGAPCSCTPVPYEEKGTPVSLKPGGPVLFHILKPTVNRWTLRMWPRNSKSPAVKVEVMAKDKEEALSKALSLCPGHAWDNLTDTGEVWEEVAPNQYRRAAE